MVNCLSEVGLAGVCRGAPLGFGAVGFSGPAEGLAGVGSALGVVVVVVVVVLGRVVGLIVVVVVVVGFGPVVGLGPASVVTMAERIQYNFTRASTSALLAVWGFRLGFCIALCDIG